MFGNKKEIKSLTVLNGIEAKDITADQIAAVNAEFKELGFSGIEISISGQLSKATSDASEAITSLEKAKSELATSNTKITELEAKVKDLGKQPAADATGKEGKEDSIRTNSDQKPWEVLSNQVLEEKL